MMESKQLFDLLPAIHRLRDEEQGGPLRALLAIFAEQAAALDEDLAQLYDDQFIETAADWAVPYIGDLIGYRPLGGETAAVTSPRAEVANTIGYRRRKGTASMLEQLARDVTGWDARVVEFFQLLATTQYMNHIRPGNLAAPHLRDGRRLAGLGTPFDTLSHTADVRRISRGRGRFNIPNIGVFLWRIAAYSQTRSPAARVDDRRFRFSSLGNDTPLFNRPEPEETITHLATAANVPQPLTRRRLKSELAAHYGVGRALLIERASIDALGRLDPGQAIVPVPLDEILVCNLSDIPGGGGAWAHTPVAPARVAIDPVLGRIAAGDGESGLLLVTYHRGFSADLGGGEYERAASFDEAIQPVRFVTMDQPLQDAVAVGTGAVEILDSGRYAENLSAAVPAGGQLELRAANGAAPTIILGADFVISAGEGAEITLNGLVIAGGTLRVTGTPRLVRVRHCTFVPGLTLAADGRPVTPGAPSIVVDCVGTTLEIEDSIVGPLRVHADAVVTISGSIVDATADDAVAYSGLDGVSPGAPLTVVESTIVGRTWTRVMELASNSIFLARLPEPDPPGPTQWKHPLRVDRQQSGCARYSSVPPLSRTPRRYHCQPAEESESARVRPVFTSLAFGNPAYGQLSRRCAAEISAGAEDGAEMGAFHHLYTPQRVANLRIRLDEYLRFGLETGIFFAS